MIALCAGGEWWTEVCIVLLSCLRLEYSAIVNSAATDWVVISESCHAGVR